MIDNKYLKGKIALVTGARRGIGRSNSLAPAGVGTEVILSAHTVKKLEDLIFDHSYRKTWYMKTKI